MIDERLHDNEVAIVFTSVGVVGERKGVAARLYAEVDEWCRKHTGAVEVVAAPFLAGRSGSPSGAATPTR